MRRTAFTLVELIAVIAVIGILAISAIPRYIDWSDQARESTDLASIAAVQVALNSAHIDHRVRDMPSTKWVATLSDVPALLEGGEMPRGLTVSGSVLEDQRGNQYTLAPETADRPARLTIGVLMTPSPPPPLVFVPPPG